MRRYSLIRQIEKWDICLFKIIFSWHGRRPVDRIMVLASHIGNGYYYPVIGALFFIFNFSLARILVPLAILAFIIENAAYALIKFYFRRTRPCDMIPGVRNRTRKQDPFSFPSGHTAAAFVMATVLYFFFPYLAIPLYFSATIIGVSRIYNGLHFPSDIVAGSILGLFSACLSWFFLILYHQAAVYRLIMH
jgi:undecaprenyl-diphosphatase